MDDRGKAVQLYENLNSIFFGCFYGKPEITLAHALSDM